MTLVIISDVKQPMKERVVDNPPSQATGFGVTIETPNYLKTSSPFLLGVQIDLNEKSEKENKKCPSHGK